MRKNTAIFVLISLTTVISYGIKQPFETGIDTASKNKIDSFVAQVLNKYNIPPANLCSDEVFIRRVYLDVIGTLPETQEVVSFLKDINPNKRALLIDRLLERDEFADYWALKWCDLLRVKAEFPINLWPNAVQAYHHWIRTSIQNNMPYDKFVYELLTSSGSNFRVPQVNFYRAIQGKQPSGIANAVALNFMGVRLEKWPEEKQKNIETFFSRISYKCTAEWKEEIVFLNPAETEPLKAVLPNGSQIEIPITKDPREVFAKWLISADNPYFAKNIVNRVWYWLMGRGIIHEPDDIRPDNPAANPQLLVYLEKELIQSKYNLKQIYRLILNSRTYQQSSIPQSDNPKAEQLFAYYPVRRLDAEVLSDAICKITGTTEKYSSPIPEPFTFIPEDSPSIDLADGSTTSQFLEMFGRPARDSGLESERINQISDSQSLHLLNSSHIQKKIENGPTLNNLKRNYRNNGEQLIRTLYLHILSRYPTQAESETIARYFQTEGIDKREAVNDLIWAMINSKEFLYRH
ncbi:MAG: DUF1549 and DUF1553 domain-containing protein [Planctomycetaceae bacterium]|nr:DUF1549 and DUF1553 domain-containing protein [Planctomycetaceae bacterium]